MAYADYRLCDVCGGKTFYDANLNYDQGADVEGSVRNSGVLQQHTRLDYLGDWCVICQECAMTHECRVVQKYDHATAERDANLAPLQAENERLRAEVVLERNLKADAIHACALANIRAELLEDALRQIAEWPDGGNRYGQENIMRFAKAAIDAAMQRTTAQEGER